MVVNDRAVELLRLTRPWVQLISVLCALGSVFMILGGLGMMGLSAIVDRTTAAPRLPVAIIAAFYLPLGGLYIYPTIKLWSYGSAISTLLQDRSMASMEAALEHQKSFWKYCGIAALVMIGGYILMFVGMMVFGVASALAHH
jgi:hypothetical protein